jgi:glycosyltransferase 2 family protein
MLPSLGSDRPDTHRMSIISPAARRSVLLLLKIAVSLGLLGWLLMRADLPDLWVRLRGMNPAWMASALAVYGAMVWVSAWRWRLLLSAQDVRVPRWRLSESFLVATFFNNFLPSNIGGDVVRVTDTAPYTGGKTLATTVVLLDRVLGLLALFTIAAFGSLLAARRGLAVPGAAYLWVVLVGGAIALVPVLRRPRLFVGVVHPLRRLHAGWIIERLYTLGGALERFGRRPGPVGLAFAGALVVQLLLVGFFLCTARSLAIPFGVAAAAMTVPIALAAQMLPISIGGFGVREAVFSWFFVRLGLDISAALALSLSSAALILLFSLSGGVLFLLRPRPA